MIARSTLKQRDEWAPFLVVAACCLAFFAPTWITLYRLVWQSEDQGHGPVIIAVSLWLIWVRRDALAALGRPASAAPGWTLLAIAWLAYVLGRSQAIIQVEAVSHILVLAALFMIWRGFTGLRLVAFPLFFLIFMIPMPGTFVQEVTVPLKSAVSRVAEQILYLCGYPIARAGVTLQIGPYQLLVADACAGMNSMFTLESLGLLYMNIAGYTSRLRNILLAVLIIPISFAANVVRVCILVLVTYHLGDEAGQGFVHGFAGLVLFLVALGLVLAVDALLGRVLQPARTA